MGEAIQQRRRPGGLAKNLSPIGIAKVGSNDNRPPFVPLRQHLEKQLGSFFGEGDISQFVQDEDPVAGIALDQPTQVEFLARFKEFGGQPEAGDKAGGDAWGQASTPRPMAR